MGARKILVIDDVEENTDIIKTKLSFSGFEVLVATDGETGLELARQSVPDLILCDIMLPRMDGWEVLSALHADERTTRIPIIFMTAYTTIQFAGEKRRALEKGAVDFLKKPFDLSEMLEMVQRHLGNRQ